MAVVDFVVGAAVAGAGAAGAVVVIAERFVNHGRGRSFRFSTQSMRANPQNLRITFVPIFRG
jgi:hypothetical protein